jgi:orotidine-5'-phosphate decarboxylase
MVNPILVALDVPSAEEAVRLARLLRNSVGGFKLGLELLMGPGPALVGVVANLGLPVFCDAKLHDIPNTVRRASEQLARVGARWVSVHASGGREQLEAAVEGLGVGGRDGGVLAVTVLTSMDDAGLTEVGFESSAGRQVSRLAKLAATAGAEGVVCSPRELGVVGQVAGGLLRVTPGIRLAGAAPDDQKRTASPAEAITKGADLLVVGRPITRAADPVAAAERILAEVESARS